MKTKQKKGVNIYDYSSKNNLIYCKKILTKEFLNKIKTLPKNFEVKISFQSKKPLRIRFIAAMDEKEIYVISTPFFKELSLEKLIENLKEFKITESLEENPTTEII